MGCAILRLKGQKSGSKYRCIPSSVLCGNFIDFLCVTVLNIDKRMAVDRHKK